MNIELIENLVKSSFNGIKMYRFNHNGKRGYLTQDPFRPYSGLTGALEAATFKGDVSSKRIAKWRDAQIEQFGSVSKHEAHMDSMADYGTFAHSAIVSIWENKEYDFDKDNAREYFMERDKINGVPHNEISVQMRVFEAHKAVCSIMQFIHDEVSDLIAVETMCKSDELSIATPIDMVIKTKKGEIATINLKTSSQIGDHHRNQVSVEMAMWNATYPDFQAVKTGVLRPKDWNLSKTPTYELEYVKDAGERASRWRTKLMMCLTDPDASYMNFKSDTKSFTGIVKIGHNPIIAVKSMEEIFKSQIQ